MPLYQCIVRHDQLLKLCFLLLGASPYFYVASSDSYPLKRPLVDLREAAIQTVGRDGPRHPDEGFISTVIKSRAVHPYSSKADRPGDDVSDECSGGYAVVTMANKQVMETLVPQLLESLHRIEVTSDVDETHSLVRHALVVGISTEAVQACVRLRRRYKNACLSDVFSGLYEGENLYPDFKFLAYGMAKLKYIVNVLSTSTSVLYVDADVVFLRNPFPGLLASTADVAVATASAPCGTQPAIPDWALLEGLEGEETNLTARGHTQQALLHTDITASVASGYAPGITWYRGTSGVTRCTYSLLLDMLNVAMKNPNGTVFEQENFAAFMPLCTEALGLQLAELDPKEYLTPCGAEIAPDVRDSGVVAVHFSGGPGSSLLDRQPLMEGVMGVKTVDLLYPAPDEGEITQGA